MLSLLCILSYKIQSFESCSPTCDEKTDDKFDDVAGQGAMERLGNANEKDASDDFKSVANLEFRCF